MSKSRVVCFIVIFALSQHSLANEAAKNRVLVNVPSPLPGVLVVVGSDLGLDGLAADQVITAKVDGKELRYRRLKVGDEVKEAQLLARLDDRLARIDQEMQQARIGVAQAELRAAEKTRDAAKLRFEDMLKASRIVRNSVSDDDVRAARLTSERYEEEVQAKKLAVTIAELEHKRAMVHLEMHQIRSPANGVIRAINKRSGEAAKDFDTIIVIELAVPSK